MTSNKKNVLVSKQTKLLVTRLITKYGQIKVKN